MSSPPINNSGEEKFGKMPIKEHKPAGSFFSRVSKQPDDHRARAVSESHARDALPSIETALKDNKGPKPEHYSFDGLKRGGSMRKVDRSSYKHIPASPAAAFLGTFADATCPVVEEDDEGQQIGDYIIGKQIGYGSFSVVKEAFTIINDKQIKRAVKIVRKHLVDVPSKNELFQLEFEHEVEVWRLLHHPYVLELLHMEDTPFATYAFLPLYQGTLLDLLRFNSSGLNHDLAVKVSHQVACAIRYLHQDVQVVHRDIKLENCLWDPSKQSIVLCDFGLSVVADSDEYPTSHDLSVIMSHDTEAAGSIPYMSPESIQASEALANSSVDIWAYGVVVHAIFTGELPFKHSFLPCLQMLIVKGDWNDTLLKDFATDDMVDLVKCCLDPNPRTRISISTVLSSNAFKRFPIV